MRRLSPRGKKKALTDGRIGETGEGDGKIAIQRGPETSFFQDNTSIAGREENRAAGCVVKICPEGGAEERR